MTSLTFKILANQLLFKIGLYWRLDCTVRQVVHFFRGCELSCVLVLKRKHKTISELEQLCGLWIEYPASSDLPLPTPPLFHPCPNRSSYNLLAAATTGCQRIILSCSTSPSVQTQGHPPAWCLVTFSILLQKKRKKYASVLTFSLMHKIHDVYSASWRHCGREREGARDGQSEDVKSISTSPS